MNTIFQRIGEILVGDFDVAPGALREDASFEQLNLDSLARVELGEVLGDDFGVDIADDEFARLRTLTEVVALLRAKGAIG